MATLVFIVNDPGFFLSHWQGVQSRIKAAGYDVHVAAPEGPGAEAIRNAGFSFHALPLSRDNRNPLGELRLILAIFRLLRLRKPDIVHTVTIKPVLWGGLVCRLLGVPAVAYISGLGYITLAPGRGGRLLRALARLLYPLALAGRNHRIVCENTDDREMLGTWRVPRAERATIIHGAGVDLERFRAEPEADGPPVVVMPARLLVDKGVREYVMAASLLADRGVQVRCLYAGTLDLAYPNAIPKAELDLWKTDAKVEFLGHVEAIQDVFAAAHIVVLPSYREGLPKALIEAAACGRAIVTTDVPGCREAIVPGETGVLVPPRDPAALADAIEALIADVPLRQRMGRAGRALAESRFGIDAISEAQKRIYADLLRGD